MKCRDFQYEIGKEYKQEGKIKCCNNKFHFCENPFDVFEHYYPNKSRFCTVEGSGETDRETNKISCSSIKIITEIGLGGMIQAGIKFILDKVKWTKENTATGDYSGASATGNYSGASAGKGSVALATGMLAKAKGEKGAWIVVTECEKIDGEYFIKDVKCAFVDGEKIKENTYYILENGEFKESEEQ